MRFATWVGTAAAALCLSAVAGASSPESLPSSLEGVWHIRRVLPTRNVGCWNADQARPLVGTSLTYSNGSMRWHGGEVSLQGVVTRQLTAAQFEKENGGSGGTVDFSQLGIHSPRVLEVDLQHEDADITGASTEVPGDSVLVASPGRIVVSACGVYMEATRATPAGSATVARR